MPTGSPPPAGETPHVPHSPAPAVAGAHARDEKYRSFAPLESEGVWHVVTTPPIPVELSVDAQVQLIFDRGRFVDCNDVLAHRYGVHDVNRLAGVAVRDLLKDDESQFRECLTAFVRSGYRLLAYESLQHIPGGGRRIGRNSLVGIVRDGQLVEAWGTQGEITAPQPLDMPARQMHEADAIAHANDLTRQLFALSRRHGAPPPALDVHALVRRLADDIRGAFSSGATIEFTFDDDEGIARVDADGLERLLLQLAADAAPVVGERGTFRMDVRRDRLEERRASLPDQVVPGDYVSIGMRHSGEPLSSPEDPSFVETSAAALPSPAPGGALATMHNVVRQSGGALVLDPSATGAALTLYLPSAALPATALPANVAGPAEGRGTILVAEDEQPVRLLIKRVLEHAGYIVLSASSGAEALAMARAYDAPIDALVTDVIMPGIGGGELSRRMRQERPDIRVLHVSGYTAVALRHHDAIEAGASFLQKPFSPKLLLTTVQELLRNS